MAGAGAAGSAASAAGLAALVHHAHRVEHDAPLETVHRVFSERRVEFLALVRDGMVTGVCSRLRLGILLGARYGFALYSRSPAHLAQVGRPLVVSITTPVREILDRALAREGDEFHEDVALVDEHHALVGLVPIDALARLQTQLVAEQVAQLQQQHAELRLAHEALRQSQGRYAGLFESNVMGVALLDGDGVVQAHNARLAALLGQAGGAPRIVSLLPWVAESDRPAFAAAVQAAAAGSMPEPVREYSFDIPARGARLLRFSLGWIAETRQVCACIDDVTEQRAMERQLLRQEKQILLDTLVGGIAHELNNKLTPVQGFSELIALGAEGPTRHYSEMIAASVAEAARIIRQLLHLSKPAAAVAETVDLRAVVDDALSMLRFQIRDAQCTLESRMSPLPVWARVDAAEFKQVVINLLLNAVQAVEPGRSGVLGIAVEERDGRACIVVADNGVGIPPENLGRIFDPFFTTKGPERGTGLGLSVCFSIVRRHGGDITVTSTPGDGAQFTVALPAEAPPSIRADEPALVSAFAVPAAARPARADRVLVVEDEPHVRRLIRTVLETRFGCEVDATANGIEAFERLAVQRYALVISDLRMPAMNGTELYLWLREAQPLTARNFVFVTGYPGENHLESDLADWDVPVIAKPFTVAQLCEVCARFLGAAAAAAPAEPAALLLA